MACPKCQSDQWKLASLIHAEGTKKTQGLSVSGGVASVGDDLSPLGGIGISNGREQSTLAALASPPKFSPPPRFKGERPNYKAYAKKGWITAGISTVATPFILASGVMPLVFIPIVGLLYSMCLMIIALSFTISGPEADEYRRLKALAKEEYQKRCQAELDRYKRTQVCMRCGHFYVPA